MEEMNLFSNKTAVVDKETAGTEEFEFKRILQEVYNLKWQRLQSLMSRVPKNEQLNDALFLLLNAFTYKLQYRKNPNIDTEREEFMSNVKRLEGIGLVPRESLEDLTDYYDWVVDEDTIIEAAVKLFSDIKSGSESLHVGTAKIVYNKTTGSFEEVSLFSGRSTPLSEKQVKRLVCEYLKVS